MGERIVIVKLGALGDVLRTTSCLPPLKARFPSSHITWITRRNAAGLLDSNPLVDRTLTVENNYLEFLLAEQFDLAIGPETDQLSASIMRAIRADTKRGYIADAHGGVTPLSDAATEWWLLGLDDARKQANRRTYGEWLYDICEVTGPVARPLFHLSRAAVDRVDAQLREACAGASERVVFNTGGSTRWAEKRWKPRHFPQLARLVTDRNPKASVVLVGGAEETALHEWIRREHPALVDAGTGRTLQEFASIIAAADWVLTSDSLGYHVACAVGTPAVCLVGPTSPWELDTYGQNAILHSAIDCIACYFAECPRGSTCMDLLTPEMVWEQIVRWQTPHLKAPDVTAAAASITARRRILPVLVGEHPVRTRA